MVSQHVFDQFSANWILQGVNGEQLSLWGSDLYVFHGMLQICFCSYLLLQFCKLDTIPRTPTVQKSYRSPPSVRAQSLSVVCIGARFAVGIEGNVLHCSTHATLACHLLEMFAEGSCNFATSKVTGKIVTMKKSIKRILCPIDFSPFSKSANYYASLLAESSGAEIIYLCVNYPPSNDGPVENRLDELYSMLAYEVRPFVQGVQHQHEVRDGDPADEILEFAKERPVDLIVMGTHGTTGLARLLHGSVCAEVIRKAECPVMAVKDNLRTEWCLPKENNNAQATS